MTDRLGTASHTGENPYEPGNAQSSRPKTRATRWLIWLGIASLGLAVICVATTIIGMVVAFDSIGASKATPTPSDLAQGVSVASLPSVAALPLGILGIVLLVAGFVLRQPVDHE